MLSALIKLDTHEDFAQYASACGCGSGQLVKFICSKDLCLGKKHDPILFCSECLEAGKEHDLPLIRIVNVLDRIQKKILEAQRKVKEASDAPRPPA
jgi:hypothetical protein